MTNFFHKQQNVSGGQGYWDQKLNTEESLQVFQLFVFSCSDLLNPAPTNAY